MDHLSDPDRTWMCSILFLDIVNYSSQSVQLQMEWKRRFNHYLEETLSDLPEPERVILDTGDGAAICFLGAPESAMAPALRLRSFFIEAESAQPSAMVVRIGINLGPVKLVQDINRRLNALGDGINVGQRVMSFAGDNQILVSRSFYEAVSCLTDSYGRMFCFVGAKKDKHERAHQLYKLVPAGEGAPVQNTSVIAEPSVPATPPAQFDVAVLERLEALLVPVLGPIARHLVKDTSRKHADVAGLCSELATQVTGNKERAKFLEECRQRFGLAGPPASTPAAKVPAPVEPPSGVVWDPAMLEKTKRELAVYIGPMAKVIVDSAASEVHTVKDFYDTLCREIPSSRDREHFLSRCKAGT
jgi:class 3 adenylate cyclase